MLITIQAMNQQSLFRRVSGGDVRNVRFSDFIALVEAFGFHLMRTEGSHRIFGHPAIDELLNLQEVRREAKPYQIRQFLRLVERYNLEIEN
jgi:predicted RNA binding protein YcfA (HicA-like mRNA interferase family)